MDFRNKIITCNTNKAICLFLNIYEKQKKNFCKKVKKIVLKNKNKKKITNKQYFDEI